MDIIKTNIIKSLSQFVENTFFNNYLFNATKNFFILLLVVYSRFLMFLETKVSLMIQFEKLVKINTIKPLNLKLILNQNKFAESDSFLLTL